MTPRIISRRIGGARAEEVYPSVLFYSSIYARLGACGSKEPGSRIAFDQ